MKRFFLTAFFLMSFAAAAHAAGYSGAIEDLPLMPGMHERAGEAVVFDKPDGRIVETAVETKASPDMVAQFYAANLPQLGWTQISANKFTREHEELTIDTETTGGMTVVRFNLTPKE